jgi:hypothetical protein
MGNFPFAHMGAGGCEMVVTGAAAMVAPMVSAEQVMAAPAVPIVLTVVVGPALTDRLALDPVPLDRLALDPAPVDRLALDLLPQIQSCLRRAEEPRLP